MAKYSAIALWLLAACVITTAAIVMVTCYPTATVAGPSGADSQN